MEWHQIVKFLHVASAIIWLGGGFCLVVLAVIAERARDDKELLYAALKVVLLGTRLFIPAALATLLFGVVLTWMAWSFTDFWVLLGLGGFAASFAIGMVLMKPRSDRLSADSAAEGASASVVDQCRRLIGIAKFDLTMMFVIVAVMVLRPTAGDYLVLATMAVILAASAAAFLPAALSGRRPATA